MGTGRDLNRYEGPPPSWPAGERRDTLEGQIADLRGDLGELIVEVERRGRQALSVRHQVRTHPFALFGVVAAGAAVVAGVLWLRARRRPPPLSGWERLRLQAARRLVPGRMLRREVWLLDDRRLRGVPGTGDARAVVYLPRR